MSERVPTADRFDDGKAPDAMRTIGEVSAAFDIKPHVLRYWEQQFPMLNPLKRSGGRRLYRPKDIALVEQIDRLVNQQGYTLKGARKALKEGTAAAAGEPGPAEDAGSDASSEGPLPADLVPRLRAVRRRLNAAITG